MKPPGLIITLPLFPVLDQHLIQLLSLLTPEQWQLPTIVPKWKIIDIAGHLLDGNIRSVSMLRDGYQGEKPGVINEYKDLVDYLNGLNADWVRAMKRVSPEMLITLLELTGKTYIEFLNSLDPDGIAGFSVAWAGEETSFNWFHIAREYTEKWHHQQQIRLAVGQDDLLYAQELYFPHLETSMRALPHHYRNVPGKTGELIRFIVTGVENGVWYLYYNGERWMLMLDCLQEPQCTVEIPGSLAWRMFTKGATDQEARKEVKIHGRQDLGMWIFGMLAVMG